LVTPFLQEEIIRQRQLPFGDPNKLDIWNHWNIRSQLKQRTTEFALYDYSCRYWPEHLRQSNFDQVHGPDVFELLTWFIHDWERNTQYLSWQQMFHRDVFFCCVDRPPLYYALEFGIPKLISTLLPPMATIKTLFNGTSALHVAARCGSLETVRTLIERGASIELKSDSANKEMTALLFAAEGGQAKVAKLLLESGASIHATAQSGATPLYRAARSGSLKTLRELYEAGSDLNSLTYDGFTPLFESIAHRRKNIAAQLLQWGADPTIPNDRGQTAVGFICDAKNGTAYEDEQFCDLHQRPQDSQISHSSENDAEDIYAVHGGNSELNTDSSPVGRWWDTPPRMSQRDNTSRHSEYRDPVSRTMETAWSPDPWNSGEGSKPAFTEDDVLAEIQTMRNRGASITKYRQFLGDLTEQWTHVENLWIDTRPGTEREKESRWTQDVGGDPYHDFGPFWFINFSPTLLEL
jgi:hypothetical protein